MVVRDKNPTLRKTCVICRKKISVDLKLKCVNVPSERDTQTQPSSVGQSSDGWCLKAIFMESFCMAFGLPANHAFISLFINKKENVKGRLCFQCFEDVSKIHHIFWQFQSLEKKLLDLQTQFVQRLRCNYEAIPVSTLFSSLGVHDLETNLERLKYDDVVKIMFEKIKEMKEEWPKPQYLSRWKTASENAQKIALEMKNVHPVSLINPSDSKPEVITKLESDEGDASTEPLAEDHDYLNVTAKSSRPKRAASANVALLQKAIAKEEDDDDEGAPNEEMVLVSDGDDKDDDNGPGPSKMKTFRNRRSVSAKAKKAGTKFDEIEGQGMRFLCVEDPDVCSRTYSSRKHLKTHIKLFHKARKFICDYESCTARYDTEGKLEAHKAKIHEKRAEPTEVCDACGIELLRKDMKRHYYLRHVGIGKFTCEVCSMDFNESEEFDKHEQLHKESEFPFLCVVCQKLFTNSLDLRGHITSNHLSSGLKCEVCGIMKPNDFLLRRHMKCHEKVKSFICQECGKSFTSRAYLTYHMEHNHENAGKRYPCEICGKTFSHLKNVLRHKVTHQDDKPYKCKICQKTFNYSHLLKKHEEIHSNTKNYGCEICGKRFRQEQNLTQHMRSHRPKAEKQPPHKKSTPKRNVNPEVKTEVEIGPLMEIKIDSVTGSLQALEEEPEMTEIELKTDGITSISTTPIIGGQLIIPQSQAQSVHQIQLTLPSQQQQQQGTTTVVFLTGDQNFHWIT